MIEDHELQSLLDQYRPAGPPEQLRRRVLGDPAPRQKSLKWQLLAAAALVLMGVSLQTATARIDRRLRSGPIPNLALQPEPADPTNAFLQESPEIAKPYLDEIFDWPTAERLQ